MITQLTCEGHHHDDHEAKEVHSKIWLLFYAMNLTTAVCYH
jgi:hypothetical protein